MTSVQPYGDLAHAEILVIGHDPRLQTSDSEAQSAFFLEMPSRELKTQVEVRQRSFAHRLLKYVDWLTGRKLPLSELYVTNLCNEFLERRAKGAIYIPKSEAQRGVQAFSW